MKITDSGLESRPDTILLYARGPTASGDQCRTGGVDSGQAGIDEAGRTVSPEFEAQVRQAFTNIEKVLAAGGATMADIVKVNIMVTDMSHLDTFIKLRGEYLSQPYPADTLLQVARLAQPDWQVEIDATAVITEEEGA